MHLEKKGVMLSWIHPWQLKDSFLISIYQLCLKKSSLLPWLRACPLQLTILIMKQYQTYFICCSISIHYCSLIYLNFIILKVFNSWKSIKCSNIMCRYTIMWNELQYCIKMKEVTKKLKKYWKKFFK